MKHRSRGFTLLEVLVAVSVLAVMGVMAYQGLIAIAGSHQQLRAQAESFRTLALSVELLERDLRSATPRSVRDELGDPEPAIAGGRRGVALTRGGWSNPLERKRSQLQRVVYRLEAGDLVREAWPVLDRTQATRPERQVLIEDVSSFDVEFLPITGDAEWLPEWPPLGVVDGPTWPAAVRVRIVDDEHGAIERVFSLVGGPA